MSKIKDLDLDIRRLIDLGHELEAIGYNSKFEGYEGFDKKTLGNQRKGVRAKAIRLIKKLQGLGFNPLIEEYEYVDENGVSWELEYAMQFI